MWQEEKKISEEQSSRVNEAYVTLLKPLSRGLYLVSLSLWKKYLMYNVQVKFDFRLKCFNLGWSSTSFVFYS